MMRWRKNREELVDLDVTEIRAARAMYIDEDVQRVEVTISTTDDFRVRLTLTPRQTAALIEQATMAYTAINPRLRTRTETYGN